MDLYEFRGYKRIALLIRLSVNVLSFYIDKSLFRESIAVEGEQRGKNDIFMGKRYESRDTIRTFFFLNPRWIN